MVKDKRKEQIDLIGPVMVVCIGALLWCSGCAGVGVKFESYRIDEVRQTQNTNDTSPLRALRCLFVNCLTTATEAGDQK